MLIVELATIAILLILAILFRKPIYLFLIALKYGKYSFAYQKKYRCYYNTNPHPYCLKEEIFNHLHQLQQSMSDKSNSLSQVSAEILYFPLPATAKDLMKWRGKPNCFNSYSDHFFDLCVFGYEEVQFGQPAKRLYYFNYNKLIFSELIFDDFPQTRAKAITSAISILFQRNMEEAKKMNLELSDHTQLHYSNSGFRISIKIYSTKNEQFTELMHVFDQRQLALKQKINAQYFQPV
jgi:hypothetical protein